MRHMKSDHWLRRAAQLFESGKLAQAEKLARQNFKAEPTAAANLLAGVALKRGDLVSAQKFLARALRESPDALAIRMNLINVARQAGDESTALKNLEFVVANAPGDAAAQYDLGCLYLDVGRIDGAISALSESDRISPDPATKERLAEAYLRAERVEDAAGAAMSAIAGGRESAQLHYIVGRNLLASNKVGLAVESFHKALALDPEHVTSLVDISRAKALLTDIVGARHAARRALEIRPCVSVGSHAAAFRVAVLHEMKSGYFRGKNAGLSAYRSGNFPSQLEMEGARVDHFAVDLTRTDQGFGDAQADIVLNNLVNGNVLQKEMAFDAARRACAAFDAPVVNPPEAAVKTTRQNTYDLLKDSDLYIFPSIMTFRAIGTDRRQSSDRIIAEVGAPVILRPASSQVGGGAVLCRTEDEIRARVAGWAYGSLCAIRFYDCRDEGGNAVQYRICVLDGRFYPNRRNVAPTWHSHGGDREAMGWYENGFAAAEERFLDDPASVLGGAPETVLRPFLERLELDIFGVDFGVDQDGRVIIFETNASMNLSNSKHFAFCPYKVAHEERFLNDVRDYLARRAGKTGV